MAFLCVAEGCHEVFATLGENVQHQTAHAHESKFRFGCPPCGLKFLTYNALCIHVTRLHQEERHVVVGKLVLYKCFMCEKRLQSSWHLCQHIIHDHQRNGIFTKCPFKEICKSPNLFAENSFRVNLTQKHKGWNSNAPGLPMKSTCTEVENPDDDAASNIGFVSDDNEMGFEEAEGHDAASELHGEEDLSFLNILKMKDEFYLRLGKFYLMLESKCVLPISTINIISQGLAQLTESHFLILGEAISSKLKGLNISSEEKERVKNDILGSDCMYAAHHKDVCSPTFTTDSLRKKYFKSHFKFLEPEEINISRDTNEPRCVYYVSIKETLEMMLSDKQIQDEIEASFSRCSTDGMIEDYKDGSLYKARKERNNQKTIDLFIFQDAFTLTKDLSSVANLHQILGMYLTIGNLRPFLRSKLDFMRLILLIPNFSKMFKDFNHKCFSKVVSALKELQVSGIDFKGERVRVQLQFLIGDNKGQHEIGGFIGSFSGTYSCRFCPMTKEEIRREPWRVHCLRTPQSYDEAVSLAQAGGHHEGVKYSSIFNLLEDFHVCDPSLAPCLGHDLFLGLLNYDMSKLIKYLVYENKWFSYDVLNRRIKDFKYIGHDSGNKPAPVRFDLKKKNDDLPLGGHAVQNWTLLRLLPFILGDDLIRDSNDQYWQLLLQLKQIVELLCSPSITFSQLTELKVKIEDFMHDRMDCLEDPKPKHHICVHSPDLYEIMGPLIHLFTLRFENYHQYFKRVAKNANNFINVGKTLASKYCMYLAYKSSGSTFCAGVTVLEEGIPVFLKVATSPDSGFTEVLVSNSIKDSALIMKSIIVDEVRFTENEWLLLGALDDNAIAVCQIRSILLEESNVFLVVEEHEAKFLDHVGIYVVDSDILKLSCISTQDVKYPYSQSMYEWGDHKLCFSLKHSLVPVS